jgi:hypothetical protein
MPTAEDKAGGEVEDEIEYDALVETQFTAVAAGITQPDACGGDLPKTGQHASKKCASLRAIIHRRR